MNNIYLNTLDRAPISVHINEQETRLDVLNSSRYDGQNPETKEILKSLGYRVSTMGNIYSIAEGMGNLAGLKTGLESVYGISSKTEAKKENKETP